MLVTLVFDESEGDDGECDADPPVPYTSCSLSHTERDGDVALARSDDVDGVQVRVEVVGLHSSMVDRSVEHKKKKTEGKTELA
jgi:hypothetical protein